MHLQVALNKQVLLQKVSYRVYHEIFACEIMKFELKQVCLF